METDCVFCLIHKNGIDPFKIKHRNYFNSNILIYSGSLQFRHLSKLKFININSLKIMNNRSCILESPKTDNQQINNSKSSFQNLTFHRHFPKNQMNKIIKINHPLQGPIEQKLPIKKGHAMNRP